MVFEGFFFFCFLKNFHLCLEHFRVDGPKYDLMWDHFKTRCGIEVSQVSTTEEVKSMNVSDVKMTDEDSFLSLA